MPKSVSPEDFLGSQPPERIIGTETEYQIQLPSLSNMRFLKESLGRQGLAFACTFISNGARAYGDIEYCTPECLGPRQATAADHAGIIVVNNMGREHLNGLGRQYFEWNEQYEETVLPSLRIAGSYDPKKKEDDHESDGYETTGRHENFLTVTPGSFEKHLRANQVLSSYLGSRIIWDGAGLVGDGRYLLSQKARGIGNEVGFDYGDYRTEHGAKPMAALMDPSTTDVGDKISEGWALLEVRLAEGHMLRTSTFTSLAATSLVLRALEHDAINHQNASDFTFRNPLMAMHTLNNNLGRGSFRLASGKTTTGLELQRRLMETALSLNETIAIPPDELAAGKRLIQTFDIMESLDPKEPDISRLIHHVEWAAKLCLLRRKFGEDFYTNRLAKAIGRDRQWHRIDKADEAPLRKIDLMYDELEPEVQNLRSHAPVTTRAAARAEMITTGLCKTAGWNGVTINSGGTIELHDPFNPELPENIAVA